MDYKKLYEEARAHLVEYVGIEDKFLIDDHENLPLKELVDIVIDKHNMLDLDNALLETAYIEGLPVNKYDAYLDKAEELFQKMNKKGEIGENAFVEIIKEMKKGQ